MKKMKRKEITPKDLKERVEKHGTKVGLFDVKVDGVITILDKDGNIKGQMTVTNDLNEVEKDAT